MAGRCAGWAGHALKTGRGPAHRFAQLEGGGIGILGVVRRLLRGSSNGVLEYSAKDPRCRGVTQERNDSCVGNSITLMCDVLLRGCAAGAGGYWLLGLCVLPRVDGEGAAERSNANRGPPVLVHRGTSSGGVSTGTAAEAALAAVSTHGADNV